MIKAASLSGTKAWGLSCLVWGSVLLLHSVAAYSDQLRRGGHASLADLLPSYALAYLPWMAFSAALLHALSSRAERLRRPSFVVTMFVVLAIVYLVPQGAYQVAVSMWGTDAPWSALPRRFAQWPAIYWLIDAGLFVLTFAVVYAFVTTRANQAAHEQRLKADAENLALRLELEQHRLHALRGQLEPHFMFNALNAISGLVRGDDKGLALSALQQLSALLRYALAASQRDFVTLGEEMDFVRDYVRLQGLRFGDRLEAQIDEEPADLRAADCPPLLLQPLVENAIRHDLEGHEDASRVTVSLRHEGDRVVIVVQNPLRQGTAPNPGAGLGLKSTRERLWLLYGNAADCATASAHGQFTATLSLPLTRPEPRETPS